MNELDKLRKMLDEAKILCGKTEIGGVKEWNMYIKSH